MFSSIVQLSNPEGECKGPPHALCSLFMGWYILLTKEAAARYDNEREWR